MYLYKNILFLLMSFIQSNNKHLNMHMLNMALFRYRITISDKWFPFFSVRIANCFQCRLIIIKKKREKKKESKRKEKIYSVRKVDYLFISKRILFI